METQKEEDNIFYSVKLINGIFFLILILSSGFVSGITNCKYQKLFQENVYLKHLVAFFILYFLNTNLYTIKDHPIKKLRNSIILYIVFIIIMRQNKQFTILSFILIFIIHMLYEYYDYYKDNDKFKYSNHIKELHTTIRIFSLITIMIIIIGLVINYKERHIEYGKNFSFNKFILGNIKCSK